MTTQPQNSAFVPSLRIEYNDGRQGHCGVMATILEVGPTAMVVQFDDRADTTRINFHDTAWMNHLTVVNP